MQTHTVCPEELTLWFREPSEECLSIRRLEKRRKREKREEERMREPSRKQTKGEVGSGGGRVRERGEMS